MTRSHVSNGRPRRVSASTGLLGRRVATLGAYSPLFYREPLELVRGEGVWVTDSHGRRYLDAYNNVPHIGHSHPRVRAAVADALGRININSRYLTEQPVAYAEQLLATFDPVLDRVMFVNSGSEANDLALRIARRHTGGDGILVSDFSYHGNTSALAELTTGLRVEEPLGGHVRAVRVPDVPAGASEQEAEALVARALGEVDRAIADLEAGGHRMAALLIDPLFSTEGLPRLPAGYVRGLVERVRRAGGLFVADEVQSGFGRLGTSMWGHQAFGVVPDLVTLGKPMGNGLPIGAVVLPEPLLAGFAAGSQYFNTFATTPVPTAAAAAVMDEMAEANLVPRAAHTGERLRRELSALVGAVEGVTDVRGTGLYVGVEIATPTGAAPDLAGGLVEALRERGVLASRIGRHDNVMKVRPPLAFDAEHVEMFVAGLADALRSLAGSASAGRVE